MKKNIRIGTRGSQLALWQANFIKTEIERLFPDCDVELDIIKTTGDKITDRPLAMIGGKGLFVKEIEAALLNNDIDLAVHSMKDMPGELPKGLIIGAIPKRENPFDVLISKNKSLLSDYKKGAKIGTSSLRRASQIKHVRPDVTIESIRGNLDTRIKKLKAGDYDAIVLAAAGLRRLGQESEITEYLDEAIMIPAVGQGALCIETRENDGDIEVIMERLNHHDTWICVTGERAFLKQIEGSCHIPVACFGKIIDNEVALTAVVASVDGKELIKEKIVSPMDKVEKNGRALADRVLEKGGKKILESLNSNDG
ncbi:MAG: hydroxymethylbilane synthase [Deltaproteobacteria bacterium]|nr:MAG: hydroxymethylbilane synthase [Deltaproteobacteria bacterium]RLC23802.1 MAG: hydroxymethylbilane synthase [Deltaproteobacteria bacterium]